MHDFVANIVASLVFFVVAVFALGCFHIAHKKTEKIKGQKNE